MANMAILLASFAGALIILAACVHLRGRWRTFALWFRAHPGRRLSGYGVRALHVLDGETHVSDGWGFLTLGLPLAFAVFLAHPSPTKANPYPADYPWRWPGIYACLALASIGAFLLLAPRIRKRILGRQKGVRRAYVVQKEGVTTTTWDDGSRGVDVQLGATLNPTATLEPPRAATPQPSAVTEMQAPDPAHRDQMRRVAARSLVEVRAGTRPLPYSDGVHQGPTLREMFREHLPPDATDLLDAYEAAPVTLQTTGALLGNRIRDEVPTTFDTSEGWSPGPIMNAFIAQLERVDRNLSPGVVPSEPWLQHREVDTPEGEDRQWIIEWQVPLYVRPGATAGYWVWSNEQPESGSEQPKLRQFFQSIVGSDEYQNWRDALANVPRTQRAAESILERLSVQPSFPGPCGPACGAL